ncbi:hypothetical protein [Streptomyces sp. NPDC060027]|uniref:hypothetical protein n=1 Tax=Streptomyces sp. NPDC060027 TaxID=3347040 RepID=UPI0036D09DE3
MITPAPPRRACVRYGADGVRCGNATNRADGWCGQCEGYTTPEPPTTDAEAKPRRSAWRWGPGDWKPAPLGMDSDEAYEIDVTPGAVATYAKVHAVEPQNAETEIRSLFEDLIADQAATERNEAGAWRVYFPKHGYGLLISEDRSHILRYCTRHMERTWAQYRTGVASRIAGPNRMPAWKREGVARHIDLAVGGKVVDLYARHKLGLKVTSENIDEVARRLAAHVNENVLPQWRHGDDESIDDGGGNTWRLVRDDEHPGGLILATYASGDTSPRDRGETP